MAHSSCWKVSKVLFIKKEHSFFFLKLVSLLSMAVRMCYLGDRYPLYHVQLRFRKQAAMLTKQLRNKNI